MRIVHMTSVHQWQDTRIFLKMCRSLVAAGHEVHLVAPLESDSESRTVDGVIVHAVPLPAHRWQRLCRTVSQVYRRAAKLEADVYHFHDPELMIAALRLKLRGKLVIYDAHENVPQNVLSKPYIPSLLRRPVAWLAGGLERLGVLFCDAVIGAVPAITRRFNQRKSVTIKNFPIDGELGRTRTPDHSRRPATCAYIGGMTVLRGVREIIEAISRIPEELDATLCLAGRFRPTGLQREMEEEAGWKRTRFLGWQSREELTALLANARVGLVVLHPLPCFLDSYPIKLFEYMSAGLPVVASDFPLWRDIVDGAGCGLLVDPLDPEAIASAIRWLLENPAQAEAMGERGAEAVKAKYNWESEVEKLLEVYDRVQSRG
jgi:glycosyltransferase involved in cell wall biosynthesis